MAIPKIAVVIPCYRVSRHILEVLGQIGDEVERIYVVDDCCPEKTADLVRTQCHDPRVCVLVNATNLGVGGATMHGYRKALEEHMDIIVKLDGDGQMDPRLIPILVKPLIKGQADYTKGNRFFSYEHVRGMPLARLLGNGILSFFSKASSGYWNIYDPTNGYTAIHRTVLSLLPLHKLDQRYFFESDLLFRLGTLRAVVIDIPMNARYGNEVSNLKAPRMIMPFLAGHLRNFLKRMAYSYFIRDINIASFELLLGVAFLLFGVLFGGINWIHHVATHSLAPGGIVMLSGLTVIIGIQLLLSAVNYDIQNIPEWPIQELYGDELDGTNQASR